jgi:hypothetical protein
MPGSGRKEREKALKIVQESLPYVVQKMVEGVWQTFHEVRGKTAAYAVKETWDKKWPDTEYRVIQKNEADHYAEGFKAGQDLAKRGLSRRSPSRRPTAYMPDNL